MGTPRVGHLKSQISNQIEIVPSLDASINRAYPFFINDPATLVATAPLA